MKVKVGDFYANETTSSLGNEKNIMYVREKTDYPGIYKTENLFLIDERTVDLYRSEWVEDFVERHATNAEIKKYLEERQSYVSLRTYSEVVTGIKIQ
ncbi:hypothetical protein [Aureibacillus halotolerans]|uniref:Uncharacterized protein n=1 Tax=Aureibacillus halotolerans TaxID=1508390 RepID=A0A4R6TV05_9BACI|nr:hypothetical protein [Aureibacillus halotolerans]TDQ35260.1 hypothetical protein EV213_12247 [Aureibacillus halotolerans]